MICKDILEHINNYKREKLINIAKHFKILYEDDIHILLELKNLCIYRLHNIKTHDIEFNSKIFYRIQEIEFDEEIGEYYLIVYKNGIPSSIKKIYDYRQFFNYDLDSKFTNKEIKYLKNVYDCEDSTKKRKDIKNKIISISNNCIHYFIDDEYNYDLKCSKCEAFYNEFRGLYYDF